MKGRPQTEGAGARVLFFIVVATYAVDELTDASERIRVSGVEQMFCLMPGQRWSVWQGATAEWAPNR